MLDRPQETILTKLTIPINYSDLPRFPRDGTNLYTPPKTCIRGIAKEIIASRVINTLSRVLIREIIDFIK
jgi:hypothetical protein